MQYTRAGSEVTRIRAWFNRLPKTFATVAGETGDQLAVNFLMGHLDPSMAAIYRQEVQRHRLAKVTNHVREWLQPAC